MIYNIPYNEDLVGLLSDKARDSLLILPGKYLTDVFRNRGLNAMSYDDLWFKILPSRASHIAESIIIDRAIKGNYAIRNQLRKGINEFFYYGLNVKDLVCMNSQHDLLQQIVVELYQLLRENNLSLRASALQDILNSQLSFDFKKPVYAVLPVIFSPLLFKILQLFREKFNFNLVMHGYDERVNYEISPDHPQYFMREFVKIIQPEVIVNLKSGSPSKEIQDIDINNTNCAQAEVVVKLNINNSHDNLDAVRRFDFDNTNNQSAKNTDIINENLQPKVVARLSAEQYNYNANISNSIDPEQQSLYNQELINQNERNTINNGEIDLALLNQGLLNTTNINHQFNQKLKIDAVNCYKIHPDQINKALSQIMYPGNVLHKLHNEELYEFNHIERFVTKSLSEEFESILFVVEKSDARNISIVSKNAEKLKLLYSYLKGKLQTPTRSYKIRSSAPTYCYDYPELRLFFKILDVIGVREVSLSDIFELLKESKYNQEAIYLAEKVLLEVDELSDKDIKYAVRILEKHEMFEILEVLKKVSSYSSVSSIKGDIQLPIELTDSKFDKFFKAHITAYNTIIGCALDGRIIQLLDEVRSYMINWNMSFKEYKNIMLEIAMRSVISPDESYTTGDMCHAINLDLLTSIERRFLSYDLTIVCDLKEGIWPPEVDDHFFISEETRRIAGYTKPGHYEVGYAAYDFISIIASSKKVVISELREAEVFGQDALKRSPVDSRFLSILYGYCQIAGFKIPITYTNELQYDNLELYSEAMMQVPVDHRPNSISPTGLEKLMKNPYLYALEYNLQLKYLPKFFNQKANLPTNREFGIMLHNILNKVSKDLNYKENYDNFCAIFKTITQSLVAERYGNKTEYMMTFWEGKFDNIMDFIYNYNYELYSKHNHDVRTETEKSIAITVKVGEKNVKLHAFADRLDHTPQLFYISDYKTGQLPSKQDIVTGKKPQLNLEALIITLLENDFDLMNDDIDSLKAKDTILRYIRLTGIESTNEVKDIDFDLKTTVSGIREILKKIYIDAIPYSATDEYDNYLQSHIMRSAANIEHKF